MKRFRTTLLSFLTAGFLSAAHAESKDPAVVADLDIQKYMGLWYDVAHSPNFFQRNCLRSTAQYDLLPDGQVKVLNTCYKEDDKMSSIEGVATAADPKVPAKLVVDFGFLRKGDYWITKLDPDYQWALVSGPGKKSIFILSRKVPMPETDLKDLLAEMESEGYRVDNLVYGKYR